MMNAKSCRIDTRRLDDGRTRTVATCGPEADKELRKRVALAVALLADLPDSEDATPAAATPASDNADTTPSTNGADIDA